MLVEQNDTLAAHKISRLMLMTQTLNYIYVVRLIDSGIDIFQGGTRTTNINTLKSASFSVRYSVFLMLLFSILFFFFLQVISSCEVVKNWTQSKNKPMIKRFLLISLLLIINSLYFSVYFIGFSLISIPWWDYLLKYKHICCIHFACLDKFFFSLFICVFICETVFLQHK